MDILTTVTRTLEKRRQLLHQRGRETAEQLAALLKIQQDLEAKAAQFMGQIETLEPLTINSETISHDSDL